MARQRPGTIIRLYTRCRCLGCLCTRPVRRGTGVRGPGGRTICAACALNDCQARLRIAFAASAAREDSRERLRLVR